MFKRFLRKSNNNFKKDTFIKTDNKILSKVLEQNIELFKSIFNNDDTLILRQFRNQAENSIRCCILFFDGMVNAEIINENIIKPIVINTLLQRKPNGNIIDVLQQEVIVANNITKSSNITKLTEAILYGDTVLLLDGSEEALIISSKGWQTRAVIEPDAEKVIHGPREGFTEAILINLSLIRRKLKTPDLKFKFREIGVRSRTKICICYIEALADDNILKELESRLDKIDIDGVLDSGYIQELIRDSPFSPFKTIGNTERPDTVAAKLLEGRIAVVVDGTPSVLTLPFIFMEYFQSNEDYYLNYYFASINRFLRVMAVFLTVSVPAVFVALMAFHQELIPTPLLLSISAARQGVPFPSIVEILGLLLVFELVRETGARLPTTIGQTISIVGTLVIGQAAVEARIISAPVVIVIALTGITGLLIPKLMGATIFVRLILLLLSAYMGLYGYIFGTIGLWIHLFSMRSFGIPYMLEYGSINPVDLKDTAIRAPWWYMTHRPKLIAAKNIIRQSTRKKKGN